MLALDAHKAAFHACCSVFDRNTSKGGCDEENRVGRAPEEDTETTNVARDEGHVRVVAVDAILVEFSLVALPAPFFVPFFGPFADGFTAVDGGLVCYLAEFAASTGTVK